MTAASLALFNPGPALGERISFGASSTSPTLLYLLKNRETRAAALWVNVRAEGQRQDGGNDDDDDDEREEEAILE